MVLPTAAALLALAAAAPASAAAPNGTPAAVTISGAGGAAAIAVDPHDYPVVSLAANLFADDVRRVTGRRPTVIGDASGAPQMVIAGTLGHSALIDRLAAARKLKDLDRIKDRWEATLTQTVERPFPGVERAFVIVGSDRRGTAYGLMQLSQKVGVSPWYWWADVPVPHRDTLRLTAAAPAVDMPGVKYRGIFINDEDWGLNPWASKTFDPQFGNIGPKTYEKVFELMLRLRLNTIWPAMHACSREFASAPENVALADRYAIVAGSSHCEPMLCNNVHWDEKTQGRWNYSLNRDAIHSYWEESAKTRGSDEAVWTLGIRGIHDRPMETPPSDIPGKIGVVRQVLTDQRSLLDRYVTKDWGPVAQCFVPYKEVQPIYDAGLQVPDDVTLVWADDNFGYIRRLSSPEERKRPGGAGVYWHLSYYGSPHSYTWINTTAPALIWEELHKAWQNDARTLWMLNVGDIKPAEIGIDYYAHLAWDPQGTGPDSQPRFLRSFAADNFGERVAQPIADVLDEYYWLGTIRKPELMDRSWAISLSPVRAERLGRAYDDLLRRSDQVAATLSAEQRDAYTEMIGFPAHVLGTAGRIFLADRKAQRGEDAAANEAEIARLRADLEARVVHFNMEIAGGKWNRIMPGLETGKVLTSWNSQVRWPWGEKPAEPGATAAAPPPDQPDRIWRDAASADRRPAAGNAARWTAVYGLGASGGAMVLEPADLSSSWKEGDPNAPALEFDFTAPGAGGGGGAAATADAAEALIDFLPTFRIYPGMQLRVAVSVDDQPPVLVEVPGSSGAEDERGHVRSEAVQNNDVRARVPLPGLTAGKHVFRIRAVDPGAVIDRVSLP